MSPAPEPVEGASATNGPARTTPPVRKLAQQLGVDLHEVTGTGADGVITRDDVTQSARSGQVRPAQQALPSGTETDRRIPIKGVRKATAAAMVQSAFTAPHVTEFLTIDVTATTELVARLKAAGEQASVLAVVAKAVCLAIRRNPSVNSSWDDAAQEIVEYADVQLGIAVASDRGLIVPVIRDANHLAVGGLTAAIAEAAAATRDGSLPPDRPQRRHDHDHQRGGVRGRRGHAHPGSRPGGDPRDRCGAPHAVGIRGRHRVAPGDDPRASRSTTASWTASRARSSSSTSAASCTTRAPPWRCRRPSARRRARQRHRLEDAPGRVRARPIAAAWRRVHEAEGRQRTCAQVGCALVGLQLPQHVDPELHVRALQALHRVAVVDGEAVEVAVLHPDDRRATEREVEVERDQLAQRGHRIRGAGYDGAATGQQPLARIQQDRGEHGLLTCEVPVDRRTADSCSRAEVLEGDPFEAALGEQARGGVEERRPPVGLRLIASRGHDLILDNSVNDD